MSPRIAMIRTPQAEVRGSASGGLYSNIRRLNPDPTSPLLESIIRRSFENIGVHADIVQIDARSRRNGEVMERVYGEFGVPYIDEQLTKCYSGIDLESEREALAKADVICFTTHFTGSANVVKLYMEAAKRINPNAEIWLGGNDVSTQERQAWYGAAGADMFFTGEVLNSLPAYIQTRWGNCGVPIRLDDCWLACEKGRGEYEIPLPAYKNLDYLSEISDCAEGPYPGEDKDFRPAIYAEFNKGCLHVCDFCTVYSTRPFFASMPLEAVERHLDHYKSIGVKTLILMDDNFLGPVGFWKDKAAGIRHVAGLMNFINSRGFNVEFGNGLQLSLLNEYWDALSGPLFEQCFRLYMPVEDLASEAKRQFAKLQTYAEEFDLLRKIAAGVGSLKQITIGIVIGGPSDDEDGLKKTLERIEQIKGIFRGSPIEIAFTPYLNKLLPTSKNFLFYPSLSICDIGVHPELYFYSLVSNVTRFIDDPRIIWNAWLDIMQANPAPDYLENFRKSGGVKLARVEA